MPKHQPDTLRLMLVAGEASGDAHAARLVLALRQAAPEIEFEFFGATGEQMRRADVETVVANENLAIVGLPEIARALPMFLGVFRQLKKSAAPRRPDAVILIDFPEFNLKLAKSLKKSGLKIIYYISPQIWAWREYRINSIKANVDLLLTILPFEKTWYAERGFARVEYVGNPLAREVAAKSSKAEFCRKHGLDAGKPIIALLPGSRHKEITRILPILSETAGTMQRKNPFLQFVVALASEKYLAEARAIIQTNTFAENLLVVTGETYDALNGADAAAVTSGTATLETGLLGTPLVVVYRSSAFNYRLFRPFIKVAHFGLVNLIAEKRLATELFQNDLTAAALAAELFRLLEPQVNQKMRRELQTITEKLGDGGASKRAAQVILQFLQNV